MTNHLCINGTLEGKNYASPVPIIGLYIAAASLVCMLMMLYDIVSGIRSRQRWLPCKTFTLNSVTLTLLSIATKIPVDLTTSMPSSMDQLSKLSGTTLVCISLGFLYPSTGVNSESESFSNMAAMTILIVTIFVNVCIQLSTGVIVLFFVEHIIIWCCVFLLLVMSWYSYWFINTVMRFPSYPKRNHSSTMLHWLFTSYSKSLYSDPQIVACGKVTCAIYGILSPLCAIVLIQAAFRCLVLKQMDLCSGRSDYEWSISVIVVAQLLTVAVGMFATCFRFLAFFKIMEFTDLFNDGIRGDDYHRIEEHPVLGIRSKLSRYSKSLKMYSIQTIEKVQLILSFIPRMIIDCWYGMARNPWGRESWAENKAREDTRRWRDAANNDPPDHLMKLLIKNEDVKCSLHLYSESQVSSLSIVLLVRIAQICLPLDLSEPLVHAFDEVNDVLRYIEESTRQRSVYSKNKLLYAKGVWEGPGFGCLLPDLLEESDVISDLARVECILNKLKSKFYGHLWREVRHVIQAIKNSHHGSASIKEVGCSIERLFVYMVRAMLAQLHKAIVDSVQDSPISLHIFL